LEYWSLLCEIEDVNIVSSKSVGSGGRIRGVAPGIQGFA